MDDFLRISIRSIIHKGIRSWLTMIGIFIGIAAVVSLISLSDGMQKAINEQFELLGANIIYVTPGSIYGPGGGTSMLTKHDLDLVKRVHGVDLAGGYSSKIAKVKFKNEVRYTWISGIMTDESQDILLEQTGIRIVKGQEKFKPNDRYKAAVGYLIWNDKFFDGAVDVNDNIFINDKKFEVVGLVSRIGNRQDDSSIWIPMDTAKELFGIQDEYMAILARVKGSYDVNKVAENIKKKLRRDRRQKKGEEDFQVMTTEQVRETVNSILLVIQIVVIGIAAISLIVGGVGIMNSMYTSVLERTREIGVMKAIGARNSDIMLLFLIESGIIGLVGGIIGCLIGVGLAKGVEFVATQELSTAILKASITPGLIIGALIFSFMVGCISGLLPAKGAAEMNPIDALRYE